MNALSQHKYDLAVIGGGPAGSSAARRAAQLGARVLLLEKSAMPRPKLCGGWVSNKALGLLGFELAPAIIECPFTKADFRFANNEIGFSPQRPLGVFVDRANFDHFLLRQAQDAGVTTITQKVSAIDQRDSSVEIVHDNGRVVADAAIICTGANTPLIKTVRELDGAPRYGICIEQRLPASYGAQFELAAGAARLYFGSVPFGYAWVLHHDHYLIVGAGCRRSRCANIKTVFEEFWRSLNLPAGLQQPKGHVIPLGGFRRSLGKERILTAGDAAGLVDPFNGEGISYAIQSGQFAAEAVVASKGKEPLKDYEDSCRDGLLPNLRLALWTARMYYRLPGMFISAFCSDRAILEKYNGVLEGRLDYKHYLRWAIKKRIGSLVGRG